MLLRLAACAAVMMTACAAEERDHAEAVTEILSRHIQTPSDAGPGAIVAIIKDGAVIVEAATGMADMEQDVPITRDTVFHIASLSKQITAGALAHAILEHGVSLDDPAADYVPALARYGENLTVAHLVYMTSGLTEYYDVPRANGLPWDTFHYFTIDDAIAASLSQPALAFEPGTRWAYSNINYMLLTKIAAGAADADFGDLVDAALFEPLGMTSSLINDDPTELVPHRANAYAPRGDDFVGPLENQSGLSLPGDGDWLLIRRLSPHYGGSGVMTSMADWQKWMIEALSHNVLGEAYWRLMLSRRRFDHDKDNDAFGLVHSARGDHDMIWYAGGDIDASSYMALFPESAMGVACFANSPAISCQDIALDIADEMLGGA